MDGLIITKKSDIVNIADAIRSQTGETNQMSITDIPIKVKTLSSIGSSLEPKEDDNNNNGQIHTNSKDIGYIAVPESIRLGCYRSNTNGTGRFAKGIMNDCLVYNTALTDEQIQDFLLF